MLSDSAASSAKADQTYIKDSNKLIQIDIECLDMSLPEEIRDWDVMQMPQIRNNRLFSLCAVEAENKIILMGG